MHVKHRQGRIDREVHDELNLEKKK
jgi:hypothetical protein